MTARLSQLRTLLVLGRISNLPTVWSNCLAAWLLNGGESWSNFYVLCVAATLLYLGGMFLNDAFDVEFDRQFCKNRPIPSDQISVATVWIVGGALLLLGWLLTWLLGTAAALMALLLVGAIVLYDAIHKRTVFAPVLMALCRFLLYLVAAAATLRKVEDAVVWHGLALAAYVAGLSYFARNESRPGMRQRWPILLLVAPLGVNVALNSNQNALSWIASAILVGWLIWCLRGMFWHSNPNLGRVVAGLLAGIVLVDVSALAQPSNYFAVIFAGLFGLALILQRKIPAT